MDTKTINSLDFKTVVEASNQSMFLVDENCRYIFMNKPAAKALGGTPNSFIGKKVSEVIPKIHGYKHEKILKKAMEKNQFIIQKAPSIVNNRKIWVEARIQPLANTKQKKAFVVLQDITHEINLQKQLETRKRELEQDVQKKTSELQIANQQLMSEIKCKQRTEQKLKHILKYVEDIYQGSRDGYCRVNMDFNIVECNKAYEEISGYSIEELRKLTIWDITPEHLHKSEKAIIQKQVLNKGYSQLFEKALLRKDGKIVPIEIQIYLNRDLDGQPLGLWAFVRDISQRKKREDLLHYNEQRFRSLVENSTDFIWEVNEKGKYTYVSPKIKDILGYEPQKLIGKNASEFIKKEEVDSFKKLAAKLMQKKEPFSGIVMRVPSKFGKEVCLESSAAPIFDSKGKFKGFQGVDRDITDRIQYENELKRSREQLKKIINSTSEMIAVVNQNGKIIEWNKKAETMTGLIRQKALKLNVLEDELPETASPLMNLFSKALCKNTQLEDEFEIKLPNGRIVRYSINPILGGQLNVEGAMLIGKDITESKRITKNLLPGHAYVIFDNKFDIANRILTSSDMQEHKKIILTRSSPLNFTSEENTTNYIYMIDNLKSSGTALTPEDVLSIIRTKLTRPSLLFANNLAHISIKFGSEKLLEFLMRLSDLVKFTKHVLIIHAPKDCFSTRECAVINDEYEQIVGHEPLPLVVEPKKLDILRYVYYNNVRYTAVHSNMISRRFNIPRQTIRRWLDDLKQNDLISIQKIGKAKQIFISEKGKKLV